MLSTTPPPATRDPAVYRVEISTLSAQSVLGAAARRLVQAYDDYEDALDRRTSLPELQCYDREVARAEQRHADVVAAQADVVSG